ncbi:MAG: glycerate kinase [Gaiellaceae bacterium]
MSTRALACPASFKGVLSAREAAAALARGLGDCDQLPLADGGEGTADVLPQVIEAASVIPFERAHLDPFTSSRPLGELLAHVHGERIVVGLGGTANMDAGTGLLEVLDALPAPTTVLCDVQTTLYDAPRLYGPHKGATPEQVAELDARFRSI